MTEDELYYKLKTSRKNSRFKFFQDIFRRDDGSETSPKKYIPLTCSFETKREKSPKILLTKANSSTSLTSFDTGFNKDESSTSFKPLLDKEQQRDSDQVTLFSFYNFKSANRTCETVLFTVVVLRQIELIQRSVQLQLPCFFNFLWSLPIITKSFV